MARPDNRIVYKLPLPFVEKHKQLLDAWEWSLKPEMRLSETLSEAPELADVVLEYALSSTRASRGLTAVVRSRTARMALTVRQYSDRIAQEQSESV